MVREVTPEEIEDAKRTAKVVLVDVTAQWCAPCRALAPLLEEIERKYTGNPDVMIVKIDADAHRSFVASNGIHAIPCVLVYHNGKPATFTLPGTETVTDRIIGLRHDVYDAIIEQLLA